MRNDTANSGNPRRNSILTREVVLPSWLMTVVLVAWVAVAVRLALRSPLILFAALGAWILFGLFIDAMRRRAGQADSSAQAAAIRRAPKEEAGRLRWRALRTYQAWHLILLVVMTAAFLLDELGVITTP